MARCPQPRGGRNESGVPHRRASWLLYGKTTFLARQVEAYVERGEYGADDIILTSLTRSAATVLAGRIAVPAEHVATLHALAYRALGSPPLAEKGELAKLWNETHASLPQWQVGEGLSTSLDDGLSAPDGEVGEMMRVYSLARARLLEAAHPLRQLAREFEREWQDFKSETGSIDFCDMLELAAQYCDPPPQPVFVLDEAQDTQALGWLLAHVWGARAERFIVAGDPAQTLFHWSGADPTEMLTPLPPDHQRLLERSYRMPSAVKAHAERGLAQHSGLLSLGREYGSRPTGDHPDEVGAVWYVDATWKHPEAVVDAIERDPDRTCMVLASCAFMLSPTLALLRERGLPFHNPMRRSNGAWNPLGALVSSDTDGRRSTAKQVVAYASGGEPAAWLDLLRTDVFLMRSAKKMVAEGGEPVEGLLRPEHRAAYEARDLRWLLAHTLTAKVRPAEYAAGIIGRYGSGALAREPRVTVGTVHSVKGGEAQVVYAFPDISYAGSIEQASSMEGQDAAIRLAYVAHSRASEELVLGAAADPRRSLW